MQLLPVTDIFVEKKILPSASVGRDITLDFYLPKNIAEPSAMRLLLINDGQNLEEMDFSGMLTELYREGEIAPIFCVGIHAGEHRKSEYGVASTADYLGRGDRAGDYTRFILDELLPFIRNNYAVTSFRAQAFAGFSLGGLTALDICWSHPEIFSIAGVFSGSLWWRSIDQDDAAYDDDQHRIMHQLIRNGKFHPGLRFFFQSGNMDETNDRNNNGIIDSIDDTMDLMRELVQKGYDADLDIHYLEMADGHHDIPTWGRAMPVFLRWAFGSR